MHEARFDRGPLQALDENIDVVGSANVLAIVREPESEAQRVAR